MGLDPTTTRGPKGKSGATVSSVQNFIEAIAGELGQMEAGRCIPGYLDNNLAADLESVLDREEHVFKADELQQLRELLLDCASLLVDNPLDFSGRNIHHSVALECGRRRDFQESSLLTLLAKTHGLLKRFGRNDGVDLRFAQMVNPNGGAK